MLLSVHEHGNEPVAKYVARRYPHLAASVPSASEAVSAAVDEAPSEIKWGMNAVPHTNYTATETIDEREREELAMNKDKLLIVSPITDVDEPPQAEPQINWADIGISVAESGEAGAPAADEGTEAAPITIAWIGTSGVQLCCCS